MRINCCATFLALAIFVVMLANIYFIFTLPKLIPKYMTHVGYYPSYLGEVPFITAATYCPCLMKWFIQMARKYNVNFPAADEKLTPHIVDKVDDVEFDAPYQKYPYVAYLWVVDQKATPFIGKFLCLCVLRSQDEWFDYNYPGEFICPRGDWRAPNYLNNQSYDSVSWSKYQGYYHGWKIITRGRRTLWVSYISRTVKWYRKKYFLHLVLWYDDKNNVSICHSYRVQNNGDAIMNEAFYILQLVPHHRTRLQSFLKNKRQTAVSTNKRRAYEIKAFNKYIVHYPIAEDRDGRFVEWKLWETARQTKMIFETDTFSRLYDVCQTFPVRGCSAFSYNDRTKFPTHNYYENKKDYTYTGLTRGLTHHLVLTHHECTDSFGPIAIGTLVPALPLPSINDPDCDTLYLHNCEEQVPCFDEKWP